MTFDMIAYATRAGGMAPKPEPCHCDAYTFPHRPRSGACYLGTYADPDCICTAPPVSIVQIDPPEIRRNRNCPVHGVDPDEGRE
jgi:hypothetical protein